MKNKKNKNLILLLVILLAVTVGFALVSTTLKIRGLGGVSGQIWDIHWDSNSVLVNQESTSTQEPTVSQDELTVSYNVELELPGDFYEFTVDAVNGGTINAKIATDGITQSPLTTQQDTYLNYTVTYADGTPIAVGDTLAKAGQTGNTKTLKVRVEYDTNVTAEQLNALTEPLAVTLNYSLNYVQAD